MKLLLKEILIIHSFSVNVSIILSIIQQNILFWICNLKFQCTRFILFYIIECISIKFESISFKKKSNLCMLRIIKIQVYIHLFICICPLIIHQLTGFSMIVCKNRNYFIIPSWITNFVKF